MLTLGPKNNAELYEEHSFLEFALPGEHDLADDDVAALVDAARESGLLDPPPDYGHPPVADVPTTYVTLQVDGRRYRHAAEALGLAQSRGPCSRRRTKTSAPSGSARRGDLRAAGRSRRRCR